MKQYIQIKDRNGLLNKWLIEEETENTYKIMYNGFISEILKRNTYKDFKNDILVTSDIRNAYTRFKLSNGKKYTKAEYCELWLED